MAASKIDIEKIIDVKTLTYHWDEIEKIPEIAKLKECKQNPKWHGEGDAFVHTQKVCEAMVNLIRTKRQISDDNRMVLMLSALLHDVGKGTKTFFKEKDQNWHAYGHEFESERIAREMLSDQDPALIESVAKLVRYHMEPLDIKKTKAKIQKTFELSKKVSDEFNVYITKPRLKYYSSFYKLILLKLADVMGSEQEDKVSKEDDIMFLTKLMEFAQMAGIAHIFPDKYDFLLQ